MKLDEFKKKNPQLSIYLMQHIDRIKCHNPRHWYKDTIIILRHKRLCKDGKFRGIPNGVEYCGRNLIERRNMGEVVPFSSSELKDLEKVIEV